MINQQGLYNGIFPMKISKPIQSQIMMDKFDSNYAVEMKELIFPG